MRGTCGVRFNRTCTAAPGRSNAHRGRASFQDCPSDRSCVAIGIIGGYPFHCLLRCILWLFTPLMSPICSKEKQQDSSTASCKDTMRWTTSSKEYMVETYINGNIFRFRELLPMNWTRTPERIYRLPIERSGLDLWRDTGTPQSTTTAWEGTDWSYENRYWMCLSTVQRKTNSLQVQPYQEHRRLWPISELCEEQRIQQLPVERDIRDKLHPLLWRKRR